MEDLLSEIYFNKNENITIFDIPLWGNMNLQESGDITNSILTKNGCDQDSFNLLLRTIVYFATDYGRYISYLIASHSKTVPYILAYKLRNFGQNLNLFLVIRLIHGS
jgi:hypothetical protein